MGKTDALTYNYMNDNTRFADIMNFYLYGGKQVIRPEDLKDMDTRMTVLPFGEDFQSVPVQTFRDLLKYACMRTDDRAAYLIFGVENESIVSYAMPARAMLYDAEQYVSQIRSREKRHRAAKNAGDKSIGSGEFLEGFRKGDRLIPVVTLVINWSGKEWTGFRTLHEMFGHVDPAILPFIPDYRINLISPFEISDEDLKSFSTSLRQVFSFIKHSGNKDELIRATREDEGFLNMDRESVEIINRVTGTKFRIRKREETINVCKAINDILKEKDDALEANCVIIRERDAAIRELNNTIKEKDVAIKAKDVAIKAKDVAVKEKDVAVKTALLDKCRILQNMMEKLSLTAEEAMDIAGIPEEKRGILSAELEKMTEA